MNRRVLGLVAFLALALGLSQIWRLQNAFSAVTPDQAQSKTPDKPKAIVQEIALVKDTRKFIYPAKVEPKINSIVSADIDGRVKRIVKTLGSRVRAGEVIMYLENQDAAFTYAAVPMRAPVSGLLSQLNCQAMSTVVKGDKLFAVMAPDSLRVTAEIPAQEISALKTGAVGSLSVGGNANVKYAVRVDGVSPIVDPRTGTASADFEFVMPKSALPPAGSVGQAIFEVTAGQIVLIPENSVSYVDGKPTVRLLDKEGKSRRTVVELGDQREALYVIKSGLNPGARLIIRANRTVKDGEEVEIQHDEKSQDKAPSGAM